MATFKKTATGYRITDDAGQTVNLSIEQSYDLLQELYTQRDALFAKVYDLPGDPWIEDDLTMEKLTLEFMRTPGRAWHEETPEQFADSFTETTGIHPLPEAVKAYQQAHPFLQDSDEKPNRPPTVRMLEIRLYQSEWGHFDALKAAMPGLGLDYEAPYSEEHGEAVQVLSVKAESLSQEAIKLINDLQIEYQFRDQLVPMKEQES